MEALTYVSCCKGKPTPKVALLYQVQYLNFRYLKFLVKTYRVQWYHMVKPKSTAGTDKQMNSKIHPGWQATQFCMLRPEGLVCLAKLDPQGRQHMWGTMDFSGSSSCSYTKVTLSPSFLALFISSKSLMLVRETLQATTSIHKQSLTLSQPPNIAECPHETSHSSLSLHFIDAQLRVQHRTLLPGAVPWCFARPASNRNWTPNPPIVTPPTIGTIFLISLYLVLTIG